MVGAIALTVFGLPLAGTAAAAAPAVAATVGDGTLHISGTPHADRITLRLSARDPNQLEVDAHDDGSADFSLDRSTFGAIDIEAGNGDDTIKIDEKNGAFTTTERTTVFGQNGDDTFIGGSGAELFFGGRGNDFTDPNGGIDTAFLGFGNDTFVWDPGDGSDVVEGQRGSDTLVFNGSGGNEFMAATRSGGRVLFTRDLGGIVMNLDDVETIDVNARGGTDTISVNDTTGTDLTSVNVDLAGTIGRVAVAGTNGDDTVAVDANGGAVEVAGLATAVRIAHADPGTDELVVGADVDHVTLDPALVGLIQVLVL
jgi:RTX calcium-binding nonapeptide repeat (4 copies)